MKTEEDQSKIDMISGAKSKKRIIELKNNNKKPKSPIIRTNSSKNKFIKTKES